MNKRGTSSTNMSLTGWSCKKLGMGKKKHCNQTAKHHTSILKFHSSWPARHATPATFVSYLSARRWVWISGLFARLRPLHLESCMPHNMPRTLVSYPQVTRTFCFSWIVTPVFLLILFLIFLMRKINGYSCCQVSRAGSRSTPFSTRGISVSYRVSGQGIPAATQTLLPWMISC